MLKKYEDKFCLNSAPSVPVTMDDVIQALKTNLANPKYPNLPDIEFMPTQEMLTACQDAREGLNSDIEKEELDSYFRKYLIEYKQQLKEEIEMLKEAMKLGLNTLVEASFGDSHGITGDVGPRMDYDNQGLKIKEQDFYLFMRNDH